MRKLETMDLYINRRERNVKLLLNREANLITARTPLVPVLKRLK
jgi:hypothetical protein